jgi:hypothetical protein
MVLANGAPEPSDQSPDAKKKSKIVTISDKDAGVRRLVEYFVVVSSIPKSETTDGLTIDVQDSSSFEESKSGFKMPDFDDEDEFFVDDLDFQPVVTARFPMKDHPGNPLDESVTYFCHPSGGIQLRTEKTMPKVGLCDWIEKRMPLPCIRYHWWIMLQTVFTLNGPKIGFRFFGVSLRTT